jgi:hypothetical protein
MRAPALFGEPQALFGVKVPKKKKAGATPAFSVRTLTLESAC